MEKIKTAIRGLFGIELTDGQTEIIAAIINPDIKRLWISTPTQYGKSLVIALASILLIADYTKKERIAIVAPTAPQSGIIMHYILENIIKHKVFFDGLLKVEQIQRLQTEFSKNRLAWADGREIYAVTANANVSSGDINKGGQSLMGFGGTTIIQDESALIPDNINAKTLRMLGASTESKLIKIGNPFNNNHFYQASLDKNYYKIKIGWEQAVKEGRYSQEFVDEMRQSMSEEMFEILYNANFVIGQRDSFITHKDIQQGQEKYSKPTEEDRVKVGVDVALYGEDESVILIRRGKDIQKVSRYKQKDTMALVGELINLQKQTGFAWYDVNIDYIGVGVGVVDRLHELNFEVNGVIVSQNPTQESMYYNLRTELWGNMKSAILEGLKIEDATLVYQILAPKYEYRYRRESAVVALEGKESMKKRGIKSPDIADALALTYYERKSYVFDNLSYL